VHDFIQNDEFALIILDACRYDYFSDEINQYIPGKLNKSWAVASATKQYLPNMWDKEYNLTYISANPHIDDETLRLQNIDYRPSEHFTDIIPVWRFAWDPIFSGVHPEPVTKAALMNASETSRTRMVVHYLPPHMPYIGQKKLFRMRQKKISSVISVKAILLI
jgi:hypothetical protein